MLELIYARPTPPARVAVIGAGGFVGGAIARAVEKAGLPLLRLGRPRLDLMADGAEAALTAALLPHDAVVVVSARAPCRDVPMFVDNLRLIQPVCAALRAVRPAHVVYVSSDAVYADSDRPLTESSCAEPGSIHGAMHIAREIALKDAAGASPLAILRPTLIHGPGDPHNGYGPNRFRRDAAAGRPIRLFGNGEERRDHVHLDDVAAIALRVLLHRARGVLNVATGEVASFRDIAEMVVALAPGPVPIEPTPRNGPMPHGGYRPFDIAACRAAFPDFRYTPLREGLAALKHNLGA